MSRSQSICVRLIVHAASVSRLLFTALTEVGVLYQQTTVYVEGGAFRRTKRHRQRAPVVICGRKRENVPQGPIKLEGFELAFRVLRSYRLCECNLYPVSRSG